MHTRSCYILFQCTPRVPTHNDGGTLDLLITDDLLHKELGSISIIEHGTSSDHFLLHVDASIKPTLNANSSEKCIQYRDFNTIIPENFKKDIIKGTI